MTIHESSEDYLEAILILNKKNGMARSIDVAEYLSFSKASVSIAMKSLRENDYVAVNPNGGLSLTEKGTQIAEKMYERHQIIAKGLIALGVSEETAYADSCKIEHDLSIESFDKIKEHITGKCSL